MGPGDTYWLLQTGPEDESVGGGLCRRQSPDHVPVNYILVESVEEYAAKAESLGATVQMGKTEIPNIGWFALLKDPQGNPLGLFEAKTA
jgi:predicted enzyme related to lactoylglutathione lyase